MSKFDYLNFYGGYDCLAVSKEKYTREEAIEIAIRELEQTCYKKPYYICIGDGFVRHRAGVNEDNERCVGWWLEYQEHKRSCPCWVFHISPEYDKGFHNEYECILVEEVQSE